MRRLALTVVLGLAAIALEVTLLLSQTPPVQKPSFEAASIKQNRSNGPSYLLYSSGRVTATNFPLRVYIRNAFRLQPAQLIGGPDWLDDEHYNIVANSTVRLRDGAKITVQIKRVWAGSCSSTSAAYRGV